MKKLFYVSLVGYRRVIASTSVEAETEAEAIEAAQNEDLEWLPDHGRPVEKIEGEIIGDDNDAPGCDCAGANSPRARGDVHDSSCAYEKQLRAYEKQLPHKEGKDE